MTRTDRKKELMPEVLPAPAPRQNGNPRQRTLGHMNRLLAMAATGAALGACERPAPREQGSTVVNVPSPKTPAEGDDKPPPRASASVMVEPEPEVPPEPTGYAVVDPMPPPARCVGLASSVKVTAKWKSATQLEIVLGAPSMQSASYVTSEVPQVWGATPKKTTLTPKGVTFLFEIAAGTTGFSASVAASCPAGAQHISVSVTSPGGGALKKGTAPRVDLGDSW